MRNGRVTGFAGVVSRKSVGDRFSDVAMMVVVVMMMAVVMMMV
ncbi:MAG: hypothetical protein ABSG10_05155 [Terracidiphilus sp.]